jgi:hypothetical protein
MPRTDSLGKHDKHAHAKIFCTPKNVDLDLSKNTIVARTAAQDSKPKIIVIQVDLFALGFEIVRSTVRMSNSAAKSITILKDRQKIV